MSGSGEMGLGSFDRMSGAANDELPEMIHGPASLTHPQSGWDPYEVWRTRIKGSSTIAQQRERSPSRTRLRIRLRAARTTATNLERTEDTRPRSTASRAWSQPHPRARKALGWMRGRWIALPPQPRGHA